jgi:hypothetical protein
MKMAHSRSFDDICGLDKKFLVLLGIFASDQDLEGYLAAF